MEVTVHSVSDRVCHCDYMFGFNDLGYELAMQYMKGKNTTRYEYFGTDEEIDFKWNMTPEQFKMIKNPPKEWVSNNYLGALFFGNCKLEFILMQDNDASFVCCNLFVRTHEGYGRLDDGTPYDDFDGFASMIDNCLPKRRTFDAFARIVERNVVDVLNEYRQLIDDSLEPTVPEKWYSIGTPVVNITRRA